MSESLQKNAQVGADGHIVRHRLLDRLLHWLSAASVLVLLGTSLLPIIGIKFEWVTIHWVAGLTLFAAIILHVVRTVNRGTLGAMWYGFKDFKETLSDLAVFFRIKRDTPVNLPMKGGKYSAAQKIMHHGVAVLVVGAIVTGLLMMVKIDTPFWERDIYWLSDSTWGVVYVVHGAASLMLISTVMIHIYFAMRPEKRMYTRSMIKGWLTKQEFDEHHDAHAWQVKDWQVKEQ